MKSVRPPQISDDMKVLGAPRGHEGNCDGLPVRARPDDEWGAMLDSYWELTSAEIGELANGGYLRLTICGSAHPAVSLVTVDGDDVDTTRVSE